jgi:hypothetical protein
LVFAAVLLPGRAWVLWVVALFALAPAWGSHRHLEQRIRTSSWWTPRRTWLLGAGCVALPLCLLLGADRLAGGGWGLQEPLDWYDYPPSQGTPCHILNRDLPAIVEPAKCRFGPNGASGHVLVVGDELANGLVPAVVDAAAARGLSTVQSTRAGCPFVLSVVPAGHPRCGEWQDAVISEVRDDPPAALVIASQAPRYLAGARPTDVADNLGAPVPATVGLRDWSEHLGATVDQLHREGVPVIVVGPVPDYGSKFPRDTTSILRPSLPVPTLDRAQVEQQTDPLRQETRKALRDQSGIAFVDPIPRLCDADTCSAVEAGRWTYLGPADLTALGARRLRPDLDRALGAVLAS